MSRRPTLHDPSAERDACGIGFVADSGGRPSRAILDALLEGLCRVRHRGAIAADRRTGDGAGLLLPLPDALRPEAGGGLAMVFLRDDSARTDDRGVLPGRGSRASRLAGGARRSGPPRRARAGDDAADRAAPAGGARQPLRRRGRVARLPRPPPRRASGRRLHRLALLPDRHLQGALRGGRARRVLPRPAAGRSRGPVRHLPPALLDEHGALLGAGTAVPLPLPQRRDQRDPGQRQLDARP